MTPTMRRQDVGAARAERRRRFLRGAGVKPRVTGLPCRSSAEQAALDQLEATARLDDVRLAISQGTLDQAKGALSGPMQEQTLAVKPELAARVRAALS